MKKPKKVNTRMKTYIERQKERGLVSVCVWVPEEIVSGVRKLADQLRRESGILTKRSTVLYGEDNDE